jgi:hypothetical protein
MSLPSVAASVLFFLCVGAVLALIVLRHRLDNAIVDRDESDKQLQRALQELSACTAFVVESTSSLSTAAAVADHWERRYESLFKSVERLLGERDGWKNRYLESIHAHQEGVALVGQRLQEARARNTQYRVALQRELERRQQALAAISSDGTITREGIAALQGSTKLPPEGPLEQLDDYPAAQVEAFYERSRAWSKQALQARDELVAALGDDQAHWLAYFADHRECTREGAPNAPLANAVSPSPTA